MPDSGARVEAYLPLQMSPIQPSDLDRRRVAVLGGPQVRETASSLIPRYDSKDLLSQLVSRMEGLERKIDGLVALALQEQQRRAKDNGVHLELHSEGVLCRWPAPIEPGTTLEVNLGLTLFPPREISFLAEVQTCTPEDPAGDQYRIDAHFTAIGQNDRDEVHRFILNSQRQRRRSQTEAG